MTPSLDACLRSAAEALGRAGIAADEAARDAELLARHALGWDRANLLLRRREPPPPEFPGRYQSLVARRATREPIAYILGRQEFWGLEFDVTADVLIPRPETELVVEEALAFAAAERRPLHIVDVGTGSGCIAVALATELKAARICATDISSRALAVARRNAARHGASVALVRTDLLAGVGTFDLIVSNPPYVADSTRDGLQPEVTRYEPGGALFAGREGHDVLGRLIPSAARHLAAGGRLVVEFGFDQESWVRSAAAQAGWHVVHIRRDLQSIPRVVVLRR